MRSSGIQIIYHALAHWLSRSANPYITTVFGHAMPADIIRFLRSAGNNDMDDRLTLILLADNIIQAQRRRLDVVSNDAPSFFFVFCKRQAAVCCTAP